jgi:hypothetical protein
MIARTAGSLLTWYAAQRRHAWERAGKRAAALQEATLLQMVATARQTEFGRAHGFHAIGTVAAYQERVPLGTYLDFKPLWERAAQGEADVAWPERPRHWVKTSGTTAGDKHIPVTPEALASHRKGGWDAFLLAAERVGGPTLLGGPLLFLGGSTNLTSYGNGCLLGDLSGLVVRRLPPVIRSRYSPGPDIAGLSDWERRISAIASLTAWQDLRLLSGMPSWMVILFERVAQARQETGRPIRTLRQCWPNLKVFIHGGVAFAPYLSVFEEWMGEPLTRIEVYPASEGFVGVQTEASGGITLMLDYGIFYEFVPVEDLGSENPRRHTVADLELDRPYAIVLTAPAGLWSYILGDTVRFVARDPLRLQIVGRIRHFVNAFGENVIVEEVEQALTRACRLTGADVVEFTVAPRYPSQTEARGGHEWLIEFRRAPADLADFSRILDETLRQLNHDYHTKRIGAVGMIAPRVTALPSRTFYRWMRDRGKLGDQHKVPRVTNDRTMAEGLLADACLNTQHPRGQVPAEV